jgi:chromosome partitioning protein
LAVHSARAGRRTVVLDGDRQMSSLEWARERPPTPQLSVVPAAIDAGVLWSLAIPAATETVLIDAPAGIHGPQLGSLLRRCDTLIVPVLPSRIDWRATSAFVDELRRLPELRGHALRIGVLANRLRERTLAARELRDNLAALGLPYLGAIRDTQAYVLAAALGKGIFDFDTPGAREHQADWEPLLAWLNAARSPAPATVHSAAVSC